MNARRRRRRLSSLNTITCDPGTRELSSRSSVRYTLTGVSVGPQYALNSIRLQLLNEVVAEERSRSRSIYADTVARYATEAPSELLRGLFVVGCAVTAK